METGEAFSMDEMASTVLTLGHLEGPSVPQASPNTSLLISESPLLRIHFYKSHQIKKELYSQGCLLQHQRLE